MKYLLSSAVIALAVGGADLRGRGRAHADRSRRHPGRDQPDAAGVRAQDRQHRQGDLRVRRRHQGAGREGRSVRRAGRAGALRGRDQVRPCGGGERDAARQRLGRAGGAHGRAQARHLDRGGGQEAAAGREIHLLSQCRQRRGGRGQLRRDAQEARHRRGDEAEDQDSPRAAPAPWRSWPRARSTTASPS